MVKQMGKSRRPRVKRFSVSLPAGDYKQLRWIAKRHRPHLSLQYVVQFAIQHLLQRGEDPQLELDLRDPLRGRKADSG